MTMMRVEELDALVRMLLRLGFIGTSPSQACA